MREKSKRSRVDPALAKPRDRGLPYDTLHHVWRGARLAALSALVEGLPRTELDYDPGLHWVHKAIETLLKADIALRDEDTPDRKNLAEAALVLFQALSIDVAQAPAMALGADACDRALAPRKRLQAALNTAEVWPAVTILDQDSLVPVMIPRDLLNTLCDALRALDMGEVLPMLRPDGRGGEAWSEGQLRRQAVEWVRYSVGCGYGVMAARMQIEAATGVKAETLRQWERAHLSDPEQAGYLRSAEVQGREQIERENTILASGGSEGMEDLMRRELNSETLDAFGLRYRRANGPGLWRG